MGAKQPFRIDLLDDEIETLRLFDAESQRTSKTVTQIQLLPAREFPLDKQATNQFFNNWHDHFDQDPSKCPVYRDIKDGIAPQGIEYYLSLFFDETATLFDYLPAKVQLFSSCGHRRGRADFLAGYQQPAMTEYGVDPTALFCRRPKCLCRSMKSSSSSKSFRAPSTRLAIAWMSLRAYSNLRHPWSAGHCRQCQTEQSTVSAG